jgi:hypothetical protein
MLTIVIQDVTGYMRSIECDHPIKSISFEVDYQDVTTRAENARLIHLLKQENEELKRKLKREKIK